MIGIAGLVITWTAGYGLMKLSGRALSEPWILLSLASSALGAGGAALAAMRPRFTAVGGFLAAAGLAGSLGSMISRGALPIVGVLAVAIAVGLVTVAATPREHPRPETELRSFALRWFVWVARFEGTTLILLVLVSMPLRKLTGTSLDGGTGLLGWVHGIFVLVFLPALALASWAGRWPSSRAAVAFVASLLPFGTFVFEWRYLRRAAPASAT